MADGATPGGARASGTRVVAGRYRLTSVLGRGGMGTVWRAVDEMLHRDVAVKELRLPEHLDDEERDIQQQRTLREARTAARIGHENVITIHDVVEDGGIPWIVMELVEAESLADILKRGMLSPVEAAEIGVKVLRALVAAEAKGVLHRDVKPGNILVTETGRVVLTDFGIATEMGGQTLTATGMLVGSPNFLAPERAQGLRPNLAADLWSLGLVLYMAVEGRNPFDRPTMISTLNSIMLEEPDPPRRAGVLLPVIEGLLQKDPAHRLPAKEVERLLVGIVRGDQTQSHSAAVPAGAPVLPPTPAGQSASTSHTQSAPAAESWTQAQAQSQAQAPTQSAATPQPYAAQAYDAGYPNDPSRGAGYATGPAAPYDTPSGYDTAFEAAPAPARHSRKPMILGVVSLVVALIAAAVVVVVVLRGNGKDDKAGNAGHQSNPPASNDANLPVGPQTPTPSASSGAPTTLKPPGSGAPPTPAGYTWVQDPAGFSMMVPSGWTRVTNNTGVDFMDPKSKTLLRVSTTTGNKKPLDNFTALDKQFAGVKQEYATLQLGAYQVGVPGWDAAVWEFKWIGNPFDPQSATLKPSHAIDLGMRTDKGKDFAIYVASFEADWSTAKPIFDTAVANFRQG
ncbi:serine/threonine-protein kinase [Yinghuangia seranimata]|uniref:serine/threonine-protein kinase n=1 Tax=Yinghuangia seranimata TaxID=408067 RepID=UPI00248A9832|nr:serine/threonine-protein kinase [Yinghuangia seranimata]MDI2126821.1 protein kinase [Yinghuangia seranimata]